MPMAQTLPDLISSRLHGRLTEDLLALYPCPDHHRSMDIERFGPRPVFAQIAGQLLADLQTRLVPGQRLPCEADLAARFNVNRHTLRHAIDVLVADGWLERRRGIGTFVLNRPIEYPLSERSRFTVTMKDLGLSSEISVLSTCTEPADDLVAKRLQIEPGDTTFHIESLRSVDGVPVTVITHYLPAYLLPDLLIHLRDHSLQDTIQRHYCMVMLRHLTLIGAMIPTSQDASVLMVPRTLPLIRIRTVNIDAETQKPLEYSIARTRADRVELRIDHAHSDSDKEQL